VPVKSTTAAEVGGKGKINRKKYPKKSTEQVKA